MFADKFNFNNPYIKESLRSVFEGRCETAGKFADIGREVGDYLTFLQCLSLSSFVVPRRCDGWA